MIKGVLFDIDDTLFSHKIHKTPALTLRALAKLKEQGIKIGICTSRNYTEMASIPEELRQWFDLEICGTGSQVYENRKLIDSFPFDQKTQDEIIAYLKQQNLAYRMADEQGYYTYSTNASKERAERSIPWTRKQPVFKDYEPSMKLTCVDYEALTKEQCQAIQDYLPQCKHAVWGGVSGIITHETTGKDNGCIYFRNHYGFKKEEVMAFGDGCNDGPMLAEAGIGIAVKEAHVNCAAAADYICTKSIERGGIYQVLEDFEVIPKEKMDLQCFFFDIDATTFDHSIDDVRQSTYYALRQLKEKGKKLGLCTSRSIDEMVHLPKEFLQLFDVTIALGGACLQFNDHRVCKTMDPNEVCKGIDYLDENNLTYRYVVGDQGYLNRHDHWANLFDFLYHMIPPAKKYEGESISHLLFYPDYEDQFEDMKKLMPSESFVMLSKAAEIMPTGVDKGSGMLEAARLLGFKQENTCAFGDSMNDAAMIKAARLGIGMGGGDPQLFEYCDYVTDKIEEEGLYKALVHYGLIEPCESYK